MAIESSQEKFLTMILGFYSAAATIVAALVSQGDIVRQIAWPLSAIAVLIGAYAWFFSHGRNNARYHTRCIFVEVEAALGFYQAGTFVQNQSLYTLSGYRHYPDKSFLKHSIWIVPAATGAFVAFLLYLRYAR